MANHDSSIADVIRDAFRDARELVRSEIALARAEARQELRVVGRAAAMLAAAAFAAVIGLVFLLTAAAWAISETAGWPVWAGYLVVAAVTLLAAGGLAVAGRQRLQVGRHMPRTVDTMKENLQWTRARMS